MEITTVTDRAPKDAVPLASLAQNLRDDTEYPFQELIHYRQEVQTPDLEDFLRQPLYMKWKLSDHITFIEIIGKMANEASKILVFKENFLQAVLNSRMYSVATKSVSLDGYGGYIDPCSAEDDSLQRTVCIWRRKNGWTHPTWVQCCTMVQWVRNGDRKGKHWEWINGDVYFDHRECRNGDRKCKDLECGMATKNKRSRMETATGNSL